MAGGPTREVPLPFLPSQAGKEETHITEPSPVPDTVLTTSIILFNPCSYPVRKLHFAEEETE